jgi:hypothetical protein
MLDHAFDQGPPEAAAVRAFPHVDAPKQPFVPLPGECWRGEAGDA